MLLESRPKLPQNRPQIAPNKPQICLKFAILAKCLFWRMRFVFNSTIFINLSYEVIVMNKKLIASAVSAAVIAPVAAQGELTVYGRVANAIDLNSGTSAEGLRNVSGVSSRFGLKFNQSVGNGLTAHARYEFATSSDKEQGGIEDVRIATAGVSGGFGRIDAGNQWSAYFNTVGTLISPTYSLGHYLYAGVGGGPFRASNTIKYANSYGPIYAEVDVRLGSPNSESVDVAENLRGEGLGIGVTWAADSNLTVAASIDLEEHDESGVSKLAFTNGDVIVDNNVLVTRNSVGEAENLDVEHERLGIAAKYNDARGYWLAVGWQNTTSTADDVMVTGLSQDDSANTSAFVTKVEQDIDTLFLYGGGNIDAATTWLAGYSVASDARPANQIPLGGSGDTGDSSQYTVGVYRTLGSGFKVFYEIAQLQSDNKNWDGSHQLLGMRVIF